MSSILQVLKEDERRFTPWTSYHFSNSSRARYDPSYPVTPVINARFALNPSLLIKALR